MKNWFDQKIIRILFLTSTLVLFSCSGKIFIETNPTNIKKNLQTSDMSGFLSPMQNARVHHALVELDGGKILAIGGTAIAEDASGAYSSVESYDPSTKQWTTLNPMHEARSFFSALKLPNGKVMVFGGENSNGPLKSTEIYDPQTGQWTISVDMPVERFKHATTLLANGDILITGGKGAVSTSTSSLVFNIHLQTFSSGPNLQIGRYGHSMKKLGNNKVIIVGGQEEGSDNFLQTTEILDTNLPMSWSSGPNFSDMRMYSEVMSLSNGNVAVVGGFDGTQLLSTIQEYDYLTNSWLAPLEIHFKGAMFSGTTLSNGMIALSGGAKFPSMNISKGITFLNLQTLVHQYSEAVDMSIPRVFHAMSKMGQSKAIVSGGIISGVNVTEEVEMFDFSTNKWEILAPLSSARAYHAMVTLNDGRVLVSGGGNYISGLQTTDVEIYDPKTNTWISGPSMNKARSQHAMVVMNDGNVLVSGGENSDIESTSVEIFNPLTNQWTLKNPMLTDRVGHGMTLLKNGKILVAGGIGANSSQLNSAEIYDPISDQWSSIASFNSNSLGTTTISTLPDGRVMRTGGNPFSEEFYDLNKNQWEMGNQISSFPLFWHKMVTMDNGIVIVTGGTPNGSDASSSVNIYYPIKNEWQ